MNDTQKISKAREQFKKKYKYLLESLNKISNLWTKWIQFVKSQKLTYKKINFYGTHGK